MSDAAQWLLTFTRPTQPRDREELGWQMSFASATALSPIGAYRVVRSDLSRR